MNYESTPRVTVYDGDLSAGQTELFTDFVSAGPCAVAVYPSAGATVYVSLTLSNKARIAAGTARFVPAGIGTLGTAPGGIPAGVVTSVDGFEMLAPATGIRFHVVGGTAAVEIVQ